MSDFANLADGGRQLAGPLAAAIAGLADPVLVPAIPNGVPVVVGILTSLALPVVALPVERGDDGVRIAALPELAGRDVIFVDDGVETGTVARAAADAMRLAGVASATLAVPVCPRDATSELERRYDGVVAVARPFVRRDLRWHYADFDTVDEAAAHRILADLPPA